ncbi:erythromycin esterase family protein [Nonomuraea soli]|uniref:Erythromycin esterase n=1 Tax=Nonomuraea soli TaxID=1032476 RepID=A0A7W0CS06_9ACTN|nr:erythromycin esterase family protein [Nonomuraea soli]MBA2896120.1 erythromycin esterase [Nonomuraea soli]
MAVERSGAVHDWLAARAVPLDDEARLRAAMAGAMTGVRVVGLGEATHGSREFFELKHRLLKILAEQGFTTLAMEASMSAAERVNDYVLHGKGDPLRAVAEMGFWTWRTAEVLAVVEWLREYNRDGPRMTFAGIDPQYPGDSLEALGERLPEELRALGGFRLGDPPLPPAVAEAAGRLAADTPDVPIGGPAVPSDRHVRAVLQSAELSVRPFPEVPALRDRFMADNVGLLLADPAARVAVWAHNGHVMKGRAKGGLVAAMGHHLVERHGPAYYALGLLFGQGEFLSRRRRFGRAVRTRPPVRNRVPFADTPTTVEAWLAAAHPGDHLLDLRGDGARPPEVEAWLGERRHLRSFGGVVGRFTYKTSFSSTVPGDDFDGLAYIPRTTCSTLLPDPR